MNNYLPTDYQTFIAKSRYAKYIDGKGREDWGDTVERYMDNVVRPKAGNDSYVNQLRDAILNLEVMPSMRAMMTAGPALARDNTAGYNCSYLPVDDPKAFDEAMFILLCGTGVGFSVERQFIQKLSRIHAVRFARLPHRVRVDEDDFVAHVLQSLLRLCLLLVIIIFKRRKERAMR